MIYYEYMSYLYTCLMQLYAQVCIKTPWVQTSHERERSRNHALYSVEFATKVIAEHFCNNL